MVEGARLESVCAVIPYREFESLTLRQKIRVTHSGSTFFMAFFGNIFILRMQSCYFLVVQMSNGCVILSLTGYTS